MTFDDYGNEVANSNEGYDANNGEMFTDPEFATERNSLIDDRDTLENTQWENKISEIEWLRPN
jgi:hypothetical protein